MTALAVLLTVASADFAFAEPTASGQFVTSVPLDLPDARGDIPVPLRILYTGGNELGEAGIGWSIPIPHVAVSDSYSGRKPIHGTTPPQVAPRVFLDMGGGAVLMTNTGIPDVYRPLAADTFLLLTGPVVSANGQSEWYLDDAAGRRWTFQHVDEGDGWGLEDDTLRGVKPCRHALRVRTRRTVHRTHWARGLSG